MAETMPCRLYLQLPAQPSVRAEASFGYALANLDLACVLMACDDAQPLDLDWARRQMALAHAQNVAFLVQDTEVAKDLGADGVHIAAEVPLYGQARALLGDACIIGVDCTKSRHDAMVLAEQGVDYVAFPATMQSMTGTDDFADDLIAWWTEIFQTPCVAWDIETIDQAEAAIRSGADFISVEKNRLLAADAPQFLAALSQRLQEAR